MSFNRNEENQEGLLREEPLGEEPLGEAPSRKVRIIDTFKKGTQNVGQFVSQFNEPFKAMIINIMNSPELQAAITTAVISAIKAAAAVAGGNKSKKVKHKQSKNKKSKKAKHKKSKKTKHKKSKKTKQKKSKKNNKRMR